MRAFCPALPPLRRLTSEAAAWSPASLTTLAQRFADQQTGYHASTINSYPILKPEETGTVAQPRSGRCWLFDGSNDYAISAALTLDLSNNWTMSVRAKGDPALSDILSYGDPNSTGFAINYNANQVQLVGNGHSGGTLLGPTLTNTWYMLTVTKSGSTITLYIDGILISSITSSPTASSTSINVGRMVYAGTPYTRGSKSVKDVLIDDEAYTAAEVLSLYTTHTVPTGKTPLAFYRCEEEKGGNGALGYNCIANTNHLTFSGITESTFHAADTGVKYSFANAKGYTLANNLLTYSDTFSNAVWTKDNITFAAGKITETTANSYHALYSADISTITYPITFSIKVKAAERRYVSLSLDTNGGISTTRYATGTFDLQLGTITQQANTSTALCSWAISPVDGDGYYRISMTCTSIGNMTANRVPRLSLNTVGTPTLGDYGLQYYAGNASSGVFVKESQLEKGPSFTNYVPTAATGFSTGTIIPASLSTPTQDAAGNALGVTGPVAYPATTEAQAFTGDGAAAYVNCGSALLPPTADFDLTFLGYLASGVNKAFLDQRTGAGDRLFVGCETSGKFKLVVAGGTPVESSEVPTSAWYTVRVTRVGNVFSMYVDGVLSGTVTVSVTLATANTHLMKIDSVGYFNDGRIAGFSITTGGKTYYPLFDQCGPGGANTNRDFYIMSSDGTSTLVSGGIVSGTIANIYANRCPMVQSWCINYGGNVAANGSFVPGRIGSNLDAAGNAKLLLAGEQSQYDLIYPNRWNAPVLVNVGITSSTGWGKTTAVQATSPADTKFRNTTKGTKNIVVRSALTGADLTNLQNYVST